MQKCLKLVDSEEIVCFQYQRMMRYGGGWHLENRMVLPGHVFLTGSNVMALERNWQGDGEMKQTISLTPCETPYLSAYCNQWTFERPGAADSENRPSQKDSGD